MTPHLRPISRAAAMLGIPTWLAASLFAPSAPADASTAPPRRTNNWNQWDDDARDGETEGTTKLALGMDYARVGAADYTVRFAAEAEHLLRNRWGVVGTLALPIEGDWVAPATLGLRFHFVPKFPLDPFLGVAGGVAWFQPSGLPAAAAPMASARAGFAFYYLGLFFVQVSGGYDFTRYGRAGVEMDRGGASFDGRLGVSF